MSLVVRLLDEAIARYGSQEALGKATGYSQNAIHRARKEKRCSPAMAVRIDAATNGAISKAQLCPRVFGDHQTIKLKHRKNGHAMRKVKKKRWNWKRWAKEAA